MNRILLIGNGFDLAHNLNTKYEHFILDYLKSVAKNLNHIGKHRDELLEIHLDEERIRPKDIINATSRNFLKQIESAGFRIRNGSELIVDLINNFDSSSNWVDIERLYYAKLKSRIRNTLSDEDLDFFKRLNTDLNTVKIKLSQYLKNEYSLKRGSEIIKPIQSLKDVIFENVKSVWDNAATSWNKIEQVYVLNFNYTSTFQDFYSEKDISEIRIHGNLEDQDPSNLIFGYGDELDKDYEQIQELNENELLTHIKTFKYFNNNLYRSFSDIIEYGERFEVFVLGHSLGLTDRTLLSQIFNSKNLDRVVLFYKDRDDYNAKIFNISRHFKDRVRLRTLVTNFQNSKQFPQLEKIDVRNTK